MDKDPGLTSLSDAEGQDRCFAYGMQTILDGIKEDLREFRVEHQVWFSERSLVEHGAVEETFERLKKAGLSFEKDGALWFRTTDFGDDKDTSLRTSPIMTISIAVGLIAWSMSGARTIMGMSPA